MADILNIDYVLCPYCMAEGKEKRLKMVTRKHLVQHQKTLEDAKKDFPDALFICKKSSDKKKEIGNNCSTANKMKLIKCCNCGKEIEVRNNTANKQLCSNCLEKWKNGDTEIENPDGRTKISSNEAREKTMLNTYGVTNCRNIDGVSEKIKKTNEKIHGGTGFGSEVLADKSQDTMEKEYGERNWYKTVKGREQAKKQLNSEEANLKSGESRKGMKSPFKDKSILQKFKGDKVKTKEYLEMIKRKAQEKFLETFGNRLEELNLELIDNYHNAVTKTLFKCTKCGEEFISTWGKIKDINNRVKGYNDCPVCFPRHSGKSQPETEIIDFIKSIDGDLEIIQSDRTILKGSEIDIYIPSKKVGIEYNGLYYHSSLNPDNSKEKVKNSHIDKSIGCEQVGIRLIQIREDQWLEKKDIVKNSLKQILGYTNNMMSISAEDCVIKEMTSKKESKEKAAFFGENCLYGNDQSSSKLGAYHDNKLVAMMTFSFKNKNDKTKWDFKNFVVKLNYSINGISQKLFDYFKDNYEWEYITVVADRAWTNGNLFRHLGFTFVGYQIADFYAVDDNRNLYHKDYRKQLDRKNIKHGIYYDSGFVRFVMKKGILTENELIDAKSKFYHAELSTEFSFDMISNCLKCGKEFKHHKNLSKSKLYCSECGGTSAADNSVEIKCANCGEIFAGNKHQSKSDSYCKVCRDKGFRNNNSSMGGKLGADRKYRK